MFNQSKELDAYQEKWREKYIYPLQKMFSGTGIFFTSNIIDIDRELEDTAKRLNKLIGDYSVRQRMAEFVSSEAAELYYKMIQNPFPWNLEWKF